MGQYFGGGNKLGWLLSQRGGTKPRGALSLGELGHQAWGCTNPWGHQAKGCPAKRAEDMRQRQGMQRPEGRVQGWQSPKMAKLLVWQSPGVGRVQWGKA